MYGFRLLWPLNYIIFRFPRQFLDLQKLSRAPSPFGPVCSACWQPRTERWHSDPPLHRPEWEAGRTNSRHSLVNLQASCVMTPMSSQKKYYLDQLRCRSDYRRAELADLMREKEKNACCENSKNRGVHRWSCGSLCIWRSTKLACRLSALAVIQVHWLVWIKRTLNRPFKSKKKNNNNYAFWKYLSYR